jgi:hypothetical protein
MRTDDARPCTEEVIKFCQLPPANGWLELPAGLVRRCGELLKGLLALYDAGLIDTGDGLARAVFEAVVTGLWLLEDLDKHSEALVRDFRKQLGSLANELPEIYQPQLDDLIAWMEETFRDSRGKEMPRVNKRMADEVRGHYLRYREVSARTHATLVSATLHSARESQYFSDGYVPYSGFLAAMLAISVRFKMGLPSERLANIGAALAAINDGVTPWPVPDPPPADTVVRRPTT